MVTHELKTWPLYFEAIKQNRKTFEVRKDDRGFGEGNWLDLREWEPADDVHGAGQYTGRRLSLQVSYVMRGPAFGVAAGWVVLGLGDYHAPAVQGPLAADEAEVA
jgi:hypothetical protein